MKSFLTLICILMILTLACTNDTTGGKKKGRFHTRHATYSEQRVLIQNLKDSLGSWFKGKCFVVRNGRMYFNGNIKATVKIPFGTTLDELGRVAYQDFKPLEKVKGIGCIKLFYDMSANYSDVPYSDVIKAGSTFTFYSPDLLGYEPIQLVGGSLDSFSLVANIVRGDITLRRGYVVEGPF